MVEPLPRPKFPLQRLVRDSSGKYRKCLSSLKFISKLSKCHTTVPIHKLMQFPYLTAATSWMAPPQIYEHARLIRFSNFDAIRSFSASRQEFSLTRWLPVALHTADGLASILPGDSLYPTGRLHESSPPKIYKPTCGRNA